VLTNVSKLAIGNGRRELRGGKSIMIECVRFGGVEFAIIVRSDFHEPGVHFFTAADYSQQLGYMRHPAGHVIEAHVHNPVPRAVHLTREALFIRRGRLRVDFYTDAGEYFESRELGAGDVILLTAGGHGFEVLEEIEMVEVKQGPYCGDADKRRINDIRAAKARIKENRRDLHR
jgi:mannose-6-phosphate isomerase-like protein (cupin superfamily)